MSFVLTILSLNIHVKTYYNILYITNELILWREIRREEVLTCKIHQQIASSRIWPHLVNSDCFILCFVLFITLPRGHAHSSQRWRCQLCKYFSPSLSGHSKSNLKIPSDRHFLLLHQQPEQATATFLSYQQQQSCISSCPNREKRNRETES